MKYVTLGEIAKIGSGQSAPQDPSAFTTFGQPFIRAGSLESLCAGKSADSLEKINAENAAKHGMKLYPVGTIVFAKSGMSATKNRVYCLKAPSYIVSHLATVEANSQKTDVHYLTYFLQKYGTSRLIQDPAYPSIGRDDIEAVLTPLPPLDEQRRIARILDQADRLRRLRRHARQQTDTFLQSVFIEMFGDPFTNPMGWDLMPFDEVCTIESNTVMPNVEPFLDFLHIGGANIESGSGRLVDLKTSREEGLTSIKFHVKPDNILFSKIRPKLRKVAFPKFEALCSADIYPIKPNTKKCSPEYLLWHFRSEHFSKIVSERAESRSNIPKVNRDELNELYLPCPPMEIQEKFSLISKSLEIIHSQQQEAERQAEMNFQALLHRAFSGQLAPEAVGV